MLTSERSGFAESERSVERDEHRVCLSGAKALADCF